MSLFIIVILIIIIFVMNVLLIHKNTQVSSLKNQVAFLQYSLEQLMEKEKHSEQDPEKSGCSIAY